MFLMPTGASAVLSSKLRWSLGRSAVRRRGTNRYATEAPSCRHTAPRRTRERDASAALRSDRFGIDIAASRIAFVPRDCRQVKLLTGKSVVPPLPGLNAGVSAAASR
jgi:hypothetical protein